MSKEIEFDDELDVSGKHSPMPLLKSRKAINKLDRKEVLKVITTDSDSVADLQKWADDTKNIKLVGEEHVEDEAGDVVYVLYLKRLR